MKKLLYKLQIENAKANDYEETGEAEKLGDALTRTTTLTLPTGHFRRRLLNRRILMNNWLLFVVHYPHQILFTLLIGLIVAVKLTNRTTQSRLILSLRILLYQLIIFWVAARSFKIY